MSKLGFIGYKYGGAVFFYFTTVSIPTLKDISQTSQNRGVFHVKILTDGGLIINRYRRTCLVIHGGKGYRAIVIYKMCLNVNIGYFLGGSKTQSISVIYAQTRGQESDRGICSNADQLAIRHFRLKIHPGLQVYTINGPTGKSIVCAIAGRLYYNGRDFTIFIEFAHVVGMTKHVAFAIYSIFNMEIN